MFRTSLQSLVVAALISSLTAGCSSRVEKICKKMALLMGSSAESKTKIARCVKRAKRARKLMPKRFECRARCIESSIDRAAFNACNDKCDPAAAARRAVLRAARAKAASSKGSAGKAHVLAVPREVRRKWFAECATKCRHHIKESGSQKERIEGTKKAGLCSRDCVKAKIDAYRASKTQK